MAAPQQFAEGGAVKKFDKGGEAFQQYYDQFLPVYENLIQETEEERDRDRGLALARAGFQFASGRDAKGRNIAGSGFLANLASAGETLISDIGALDQERRKSQRAAKTLALQSAFATDQAERSAAARMAEKQYQRTTDILVEQLKQKNKVNIGLYDVVKTGTDIDGRDIFSIINSATGQIQTGVRASQLPRILNQAARIDAALRTPTLLLIQRLEPWDYRWIRPPNGRSLISSQHCQGTRGASLTKRIWKFLKLTSIHDTHQK